MRMKILGHTVGRMYISVIVLLLFLAGASAYLLRQFPYALIVSVAACAVIELVVRKYHQGHKMQIPYSGIITGLIIGSVAPINVALVPLLIACLVAILSKFFIKVKSSNVFNPAALGLLVGLGIFSIGSSWWATTSVNIYGVALSLSIVLVIAAYESRRLMTAFAFIATLVLISVIASPPIGLGSLEIALISLNYFFAFLMLTEPKTSPAKPRAQAVYGIYVALVYFALIFVGAHSLIIGQTSIFIALLIGNLTYAIYRRQGHKLL